MSTIVDRVQEKPYLNMASNSQLEHNTLNSSRLHQREMPTHLNIRNSYSQFPVTRKSKISETSKSFADLKVKPSENRFNGGRRELELDSIASDLSGDEWHEIIKFERERFEEDKQK